MNNTSNNFGVTEYSASHQPSDPSIGLSRYMGTTPWHHSSGPLLEKPLITFTNLHPESHLQILCCQNGVFWDSWVQYLPSCRGPAPLTLHPC